MSRIKWDLYRIELENISVHAIHKFNQARLTGNYENMNFYKNVMNDVNNKIKEWENGKKKK